MERQQSEASTSISTSDVNVECDNNEDDVLAKLRKEHAKLKQELAERRVWQQAYGGLSVATLMQPDNDHYLGLLMQMDSEEPQLAAVTACSNVAAMIDSGKARYLNSKTISVSRSLFVSVSIPPHL